MARADWRSASAYEDLRPLDAPAFAYEFLLRNPDFLSDHARLARSSRSRPLDAAEAEAFALGRKIRVTKVPFSASAKALINADPRGFVKIVSDPATGVVLGGSIVGRLLTSKMRAAAMGLQASAPRP